MGTTKIEWADYTYNHWIGCTKIAPECKHCYAETWALRWLKDEKVWGGSDATRHVTTDAYHKQPIKWNQAAWDSKTTKTVFCSSLADWAEDRPELAPLRVALFDLIRATDRLEWLLLTKRYENSVKLLQAEPDIPKNLIVGFTTGTPLSLERAYTSMRALTKMKIPYFLSCEPLLENIAPLLSKLIWNFPEEIAPMWVIAGGESGNATDIRPTHPQWIHDLAHTCKRVDIPFMFKQWGEWMPATREEILEYPINRLGVFSGDAFMNAVIGAGTAMVRKGKHATGRSFYGQEYNGNPFSHL